MRKKKKNYGWIGGILMAFFTPATSYGYRVVYDAASSIKAKVFKCIELKKKHSGSHFG